MTASGSCSEAAKTHRQLAAAVSEIWGFLGGGAGKGGDRPTEP